MERFAKYSKLYLIDFFHFFAKRRKSAEKTNHRKKNTGVTGCPRSLNARKVKAMAICPTSVHLPT